MSISFNSSPAHPTRPHNATKALYVIIYGKIHENKVQKCCWHKLIFDVPADFFFPQCQPVPGAYLGQSGLLRPTSDTQKTWAKNSKQLTVENFGTETETECCSHPFTTKKPRNQRHILIFFEWLLP